MDQPVTLIGDFTKANSFDKSRDRMAIVASLDHINDTFSNLPGKHEFRYYISNMEGHERYCEYGLVSIPTVSRIFPDMAHRMAADAHEGKIVVILTNNIGDRPVAPSAWIIAHRTGHAFSVPNNKMDSRQGAAINSYLVAQRYMITMVKDITAIVSPFKDIRIGSRIGYDGDDSTKIMRLIFEHVGTCKSARLKLLYRPMEFLHELFAQYVITGKVQLNRFNGPDIIRILEQSDIPWAIKPDHINDDMLQDINESINGLETTIMEAFEQSLQDAKGTILVM